MGRDGAHVPQNETCATTGRLWFTRSGARAWRGLAVGRGHAFPHAEGRVSRESPGGGSRFTAHANDVPRSIAEHAPCPCDINMRSVRAPRRVIIVRRKPGLAPAGHGIRHRSLCPVREGAAWLRLFLLARGLRRSLARAGRPQAHRKAGGPLAHCGNGSAPARGRPWRGRARPGPPAAHRRQAGSARGALGRKMAASGSRAAMGREAGGFPPWPCPCRGASRRLRPGAARDAVWGQQGACFAA